MTLWLFIVATACMAAGAFIAARGLTMRPRSMRRLGLGVAFVLCGLTTVLLSTGGSIPWPRAFVVVYPGGPDLNASALAATLQPLPANAAVTFVQLISPGQPPRSSLLAPRWTTTRQAFHGAPSASWKTKLDSEALPLLVDRDTWAVQIDKLAERLLHERPSSFGRSPRDTVIVVFSPVGVWSSLRGGAIGASEVLHRIANSKPRDYFVAQADENQSPGYLSFELTREVLPTGINPSQMSDEVILHLVSPYESLDGRYTVTAAIDRPAAPENPAGAYHDNGDGLSATFDLSSSSPMNANALKLSFRLGDKLFFSRDIGFNEGFHRFFIQVSFRSKSSFGSIPRVYRAVRYIPAVDRRITVVGPTNSLGQLSDQGWNETLFTKPPPASVPHSFGEMLSHYFSRSSMDYADPFPRFGQTQRRAGGVDIGYYSYAECAQMAPLALVQKFGSAPSAVLVEPTVEQLNQLDQSLTAAGRSMTQLIQDGLHVMVIGPPPKSTDSPTWLPAYSTAVSGGTRPQIVHRDPRLYFLLDNSRPMWFRTSPSERTPLEYQSLIIDKIIQKLHQNPSVMRISTGANGAQLSASGLGRLPFSPGTGTTTPPAIFAPDILYEQFDSQRLVQDFRNEKIGAMRDAAPGSISARISALSDESAAPALGPGFRPLTRGDLFPFSTVVFFVSDLPQTTDTDTLRSLALRVGRDPNEAVSFGLTDPPANLVDLVRAGVRVHLVRLDTGDIGKYYQHATGQRAFDLNEHISDATLASLVKTHSFLVGGANSAATQTAESIAEDIVREVDSRIAPTLNYVWSGRTVDDRVLKKRRAPDSAFRLIASGPEVLPPHAMVNDEDWIKGAVGQPSNESPMLVSRTWGDGSVSALAYSPAALDMWLGDATPPAAEPWRWRGQNFGEQHVDGWGVQRILDLLDLSSSGGRRPAYPVITAVREMADGATIQFDLSIRASASTDLSGLRIGIGGEAFPCTLVRTDPILQRATVQFQTEKPINDFGRVVTSQEAERMRLLGSASRVYLSLRPAPPLGRNAFETLGQLAAMSGGAILQDPGSNPASHGAKNAEQQLKFLQPVAWLAALGLLVLLGLIFSPVLRPWTAVRLLWVRRRTAASAIAGERSRSAILDVEATLIEFGANPGPAAAIRQAGLPAGQRDYETGDALSTARPVTLLAFTEAGKRIGLPPRLPTVRLRHASRSLEAVILVDCSPSLQVPEFSLHPTKIAYTRAVVQLIAGRIWIQGGSIRIGALQHPRLDQETWPPGAEPQEVDAHLENLFSSHRKTSSTSRLTRPEPLEHGNPVFLISDLFSVETEALRQFTSELRQEDNQLRVVHLVDPDEYKLIGIGRVGTAVLDRSAWTEGDVAKAYQIRTEELRCAVEQAEGSFASITTDLSIASATETLIERGVLT